MRTVHMVTLHFTGSWLCLHLSTLLSGSVPSFEPLTLALMVAGGILGGTVRRLLNRRLGNRAVDKLFIALMVVIICISAYPIISGSMPAFRRGCCRAISTRPQSTPLKIKAVPPDPCQAQVRRHCFFVRTCIHSYRAPVKQVLKAQVDCQARPSDPANRMISRMSPRNRSSA